jgi:integrase
VRFDILYNDVPMEIVSELLGHRSISITEDSYDKIVKRNISEQMKTVGDMWNNLG